MDYLGGGGGGGGKGYVGPPPLSNYWGGLAPLILRLCVGTYKEIIHELLQVGYLLYRQSNRTPSSSVKTCRALDKREYLMIIFLVFDRKHIL